MTTEQKIVTDLQGSKDYYNSEGHLIKTVRTDGSWEEYTRDQHGNELTYKDSKGGWSEYTRDEFGNLLTYKDSNDIIVFLVGDIYYGLYYEDCKYHAGCRHFAYDEAVSHWTKRSNDSSEVVVNRAKKFLAAIDLHQKQLKGVEG